MRLAKLLIPAAAALVLVAGCYRDPHRPYDADMTCTDIGEEMFEIHERMHYTGSRRGAGPHHRASGHGHGPHHHGAVFIQDDLAGILIPYDTRFDPNYRSSRFDHLEGMFLDGRCESYCGELQHAPHVCP